MKTYWKNSSDGILASRTESVRFLHTSTVTSLEKTHSSSLRRGSETPDSDNKEIIPNLGIIIFGFVTAGAAAYYHYPLSITLDTAVEMHWPLALMDHRCVKSPHF